MIYLHLIFFALSNGWSSTAFTNNSEDLEVNLTLPSNYNYTNNSRIKLTNSSLKLNITNATIDDDYAEGTTIDWVSNSVSRNSIENSNNHSLLGEIATNSSLMFSPNPTNDSLFFSDYSNENVSLDFETSDDDLSNSTSVSSIVVPLEFFELSNATLDDVQPSPFSQSLFLSTPTTTTPLSQQSTNVVSLLKMTVHVPTTTATTLLNATSEENTITKTTSTSELSIVNETINPSGEKHHGHVTMTIDNFSSGPTTATTTFSSAQSIQSMTQTSGQQWPLPIWHLSNATTNDVASTTAEAQEYPTYKDTDNQNHVTYTTPSSIFPTRYNRRKVVNAEMLGSKPEPSAASGDDIEGTDIREDEHSLLPPTQSNQLVYFDFRRQCPEEHAGDVWWNRTYGGVIAVRFCPDGYTGKVYRMCYYGGNWGDVDFSECRVQQLIKLKHLLYYHVHKNLTDGFHSLADELLTSLLRYTLRSVDDYLESLDSLNIIINARVPLDFDVGQDFKYLKTILKISDILFSRFDNKWSFPQEQKEMVTMKMVQILHGMTHFGNLVAEGVKRSSRSVVVFTDYPHIGLEAKVIRGDQEYHLAPPDAGNSVRLPARLYKIIGSNDKYIVVTTWYNGIAQSLQEDGGLVNSDIFATTVHPGHDIHLLAGPVTATLKINEKIDQNSYAECGYLRRTYNKSSLWSPVGCSVIEVQATAVTCVCHHMANIAVIVRHRHLEDYVHWKPVSLVVMMGCCISLAALLATFIAHVHVLRYDSSESSLILLNLLLAMTAAQIVFMGGIQATSSREVCEGISIVLHYLYLVSSFWLLSHGIHVFLTTRSTKETPCSSHLRDYCLLSWVVPVVLVVITFAVNPHGYEIRRYCWLSIERGMLLSYIVPIFCLITVNTTLMVMVLKHLFETQVAMKKADIDKARTSVRAGVILLPYFGVNWFLGVLAMEDRSTEIFETIFAISTAILGFLIFLFYSVLQTEVRKAFRQFASKVLRRRKSSDLKLRRSRKRRSKLDAEPLLTCAEINDHQVASPSTNLAAQCLPFPEEPFVMVEDRENNTQT